MALSNKFVKEGFFSALSGGLGGLILGGGYMGYNTYQNYKGFKNIPGNVGYDVNGQTYREDGSVTNAFDMVGAGSDEQFAIKESKTMGKVAFLDGKRIQRQKGESVNHAIRRYFNENFKNKVITVEESQDDVKLDQIGKYLYPGHDEKIPKEKRPIASILDEIIEIGTDKQWSQNLFDENGNVKNHAGLDCDGGFNYYDTKFAVDNSGVIYGGRVIARIDKNGRSYFYDIDKIREVGYQDENEFYPVISKTTSLEDSLPQNAETVNSNDMQNFENDTQKAMPVLNSNAEAGVGADNIIAPADKIAQIPKANRKMLDVWSKRTGAKILIADTGAKFGQESAGAYSRSKDTIVIDWKTATNSDAFARKILTHEGVHSVEGSEFYNELRDYAFKNLYASEDAKKKAVTDKINEYGKEGVTLDDVGAEKELVADYLSEHILSSEKAINSFCRQNPSLAKNVYWSLKKAYAYLTDEEKFEEIKNIEKGLAIFEKALNTRTMGETDGGVEFKSSEVGHPYTYNELVKKPDMLVPVVNNNVPYNSKGQIDRSQIVNMAIQNVRDKNNIKNTEGNSFVYVKDIDRDILVTKDALRHGLTRNAENTAIVTMQIGDIIENSIKVNELNSRETSSGGYVLLGIAQDADGNYYPTRIVVNNFSVDDIEVLDILYAVNAKKKSQSPYGAGSTKNLVPLIKDSSTIKVSDFLDIVKNNFSDVLPEDVLKTFNIPRKKSTLSQSVQYSFDVDLKHSPAAEVGAEAESDVKIKSNKAKNYYDRYVRTAKKDIGKMFSIPGARLGALDGNFDTLAGEYFHNGKISENSKEALFEKAWKEGIIIDDTNKDFAKALRKDLKSSTLYISPEDAKDIPDFGVWSRSQIGNIKSRMIARATILQ